MKYVLKSSCTQVNKYDYDYDHDYDYGYDYEMFYWHTVNTLHYVLFAILINTVIDNVFLFKLTIIQCSWLINKNNT